MSLKEYKEKRDFLKTPEPKGSKARKNFKKNNKGLVYAIQRHEASHLHYDLRLEEGGTLKSWAIPKLPPKQAGIRRLAVETEDHPLGYEDFEGRIPEGQYGAGKVEIWDRGTYVLLESEPVKKVFEVSGNKLAGRYCLIKLKPGNPADKNWLFFKLKRN